MVINRLREFHYNAMKLCMLDKRFGDICMYVVMLQEKSSASDMYEHVRDGGSEHDAQTMDAATESQRQMIQMTDLDSIKDADDDAGNPSIPPEREDDIIQVISVYCNSTQLHHACRVISRICSDVCIDDFKIGVLFLCVT